MRATSIYIDLDSPGSDHGESLDESDEDYTSDEESGESEVLSEEYEFQKHGRLCWAQVNPHLA